MNMTKNAPISISIGLASIAGMGFIFYPNDSTQSLGYYAIMIFISAILLVVSYLSKEFPSKEDSKALLALNMSVTFVVFAISAYLSWDPLEVSMIIGSAAMCAIIYMLAHIKQTKQSNNV